VWQRRRATAALVVVTVVVVPVLVALARARLVAPAPSLLLRDRHHQFLGDVGGHDDTGFGYWPVDDLPDRVVAATLAVEDRRFWSHPGLDPVAVARAIRQNLGSGERISGASTLAMQVARMQHPGPRTYVRKAMEAVTAVALTARYGRDRVLRHYLRIVPYGNQVHGISYAARRYLDKPVADLSWAEVAFLAAIPQAPARMNPFDPRGRRRAIERGERILALLAEDGQLPEAERTLAVDQLHALRVPPRGARPDQALHAVLALERLFDDDRMRAAVTDQPVVVTTLDLGLQREVSAITLDAVARWESQGAGNAAVVVLDRTTREVLAWVGSTDYFDDHHAGAIDYARVPRSPGSTLKPFFYALALERGTISPATVLDDLRRGAGGIGNSDERFLGPLLPRAALANSRNVPAANLLARVGLDVGYGFLGELGLHDGSVACDHWGLGLAIGGMPVTLEQLVTAAAALASDGLLGDLVWFRRQPVAAPRRILSEATARQISLFLSDPMARLPTFPRTGVLEYPFPAAVKTGTSSGYHDAWTVAWSRRYVVGAWVGHPDFRPMHRLSGSRSAAKLVRSVLLALHPGDRDGLEDVGFPPPRGFRPVRLCALTGGLATAACDRVVLEYFAPGTEPTARCRAHLRLAVDTESGGLATGATPAERREVRTFVDLGPRYAAWQVAAGLPRPPAFEPSRPWVTDEPAPRGASLRAGLDGAVRISVASPTDGVRLLRDPEMPAGFATLALEAVMDPPAEQVVWYVDGQPFAVVDRPYTTRWPLAPGEHTFQARAALGDARSRPVKIKVF
jgi:penicillin-binding protein 1C